MKRITVLFIILCLAFNAEAGLSPKTDNEVYNEGVDLLLDLKFKKAEKKFRKVLESNADFGEAHNNLAFCLRKQGPENYAEALQHYNTAILLLGDVPQPYMYRGVLYVSMAEPDLARKDHDQLVKLKATELAAELEWVIENKKEKEPPQFFGVIMKL